MVPSARFERAAFSSAGRRSNPLSYEGSQAGRQGFEPWVELLTPQPLSRRPRSSTPAPPPDILLLNDAPRGNPHKRALNPGWRRERDSNPR